MRPMSGVMVMLPGTRIHGDGDIQLAGPRFSLHESRTAVSRPFPEEEIVGGVAFPS
jgi:hypothetical protein